MTTALNPSGEASDAGVPAPLLAELDRLATVDRLLVALDFDGTVAPIVDDPSASRALPAAHAALLALSAMPGTTVALVSGRALQSLSEVSQLPDSVPLVGSHGLEVRLGALASSDQAAAIDAAAQARADAAALERVLERVTPLVEAVEGAWVERKPAGFAVHTRLVDNDVADLVHENARRVALEVHPDLTVRRGLDVLELSLRDATKADGLAALRAATHSDAVLFAGDDVTDEDALAALLPGDLGIKVGSADSVASFRVADEAAMTGVLVALAARRLVGAPVE